MVSRMDGSISKVPILLVDDDRDYRILVRHQLEAVGYHVLETADGNKRLYDTGGAGRSIGDFGHRHAPD